MSARNKSPGKSKLKNERRLEGGSQSLKRIISGGGGVGKQRKAEVTAKIPVSREDSSSNWKTLLQTQGKRFPVSTRKFMEDPKRHRNSEGSESGIMSSESRSASQSRCSSQLSMTSETTSVDSVCGGNLAEQKVKLEFRALGLSEPKVHQRPSRKTTPRRVIKKPPADGLNEFGYFDYSHYGVLRTPIGPSHAEFMADTGVIAMDCEMVGVGPMKESALARVSIVNEYGYCLYDRFVKPKLEVTDYRTQFSGIRENDLKTAVPFQVAAKEVADIIKGHILIGHSLKSDLSVLYLNHPKAKIRDTAFFFKKILHSKTPKLKMLVKKLLGVDIQQGEHSSITDAQATMALYQLYQKEWEISVRQSNRGIDILRQTLEEFKLCKAPAQNNNNNSKGCWYEVSQAFNSVPYSNQVYSGCFDGCCGESYAGSPSQSPSESSLDLQPCSYDDPSCFPSFENQFYSNFEYSQPPAEVPLPHVDYPQPTQLQFIQFQVQPPPPTIHPVPTPVYHFPTVNGMLIPPLNYSQPPLPPPRLSYCLPLSLPVLSLYPLLMISKQPYQ